MNFTKKHLVAAWMFAISISLSASAWAYLDPGTGGLIYQIGFAMITFATAAFFVPFRYIKNAFAKIKKIFSKNEA